ncbi:MAG: head GIN domain-containing protein [Cytophagales bacterium]|nr:head GIN domain-containing protein [Cytophagales bacterium]
MRKINALLALIVLSLLLLSAASIAFSQPIKKTLELPEFKSIYVNSSYTVMLKQTNKQEVIVEALSEVMELSEFKVENGVLMINVERKPETANKSIWAKIDDIKLNPSMKVYISMKSVSELQVNGAGKIISENSIASDIINLGVSGAGTMDVDIKGNAVKAEVSGSGNLTLRGYATSLDARLSGSGNLKAFDCPLESCKVRVSGSGSAELQVSATAEAYVHGSGSIKLKGNTKDLTKKVYGTGSVERAY